jgi:hypothetical protein
MPDARWSLARSAEGESARVEARALYSRRDCKPTQIVCYAHIDEGLAGKFAI